jgi:TonB family protein
MKLISGKFAYALIVVCGGSASRADPPQLEQAAPPMPATPSGPAEPLPASALGVRPQFRSGTMPDSLPEVLEVERLGRSGKVVAEATVTPAGTLADITILTSSGVPKLDAAIVMALSTWRLSSPLDKSGTKVSTRAKLPFAIGSGPARLSGPEFAWPPGAREAYHNGKVSVKFTIGTDGVPGDIKVSRPSGSSLLDGALVAAVEASRYAVPAALDGTPSPFNAAMTWDFSQANGGAGSYIEGMSKYTCRAFVGEQDWRANVVAPEKVNDIEFYYFMGGIVVLSAESLGWKNVSIYEANSRHKQAWQHALERCRANPASTFIAEYKKG